MVGETLWKRLTRKCRYDKTLDKHIIQLSTNSFNRGGVKVKYFTKTFTFEGKRYYVRAKTEKEAIIKMANKLRDLEEGKVALSGNMTVREWALKAFDTYRSKANENTREKYKYQLEHYVLDIIGDRPLKTIKPADCQDVLNHWQGRSDYVIRRASQHLKMIFSTALQNDLIVKDPTTHLVMPSGTKKSRRAITEIEREHLLKVCGEDDRFIIFMLMLKCGCRPSEARECKYDDLREIDGEKVLHIRGTKTKNADRFVPVPPDLCEMIEKTRMGDYLAHTSTGKKFSNDYYNRFIVPSLYRHLNISMGCKTYHNQLVPPLPLADDFVPYCLRHTYCTDLRDMGIDIRTAQYLMGHADINMTANIYTHMNDGELINAAKVIKSATGATVSATPNSTK